MKKTYTKRQIQEAISYWKKRLNENQTRPKSLKLSARLDDPIGINELYEIETVSDLGIEPRICAVQVVFDGSQQAVQHPVYDIEVRQHPTFDGDVIVLKLDDADPMNYRDFYTAVKENTDENLAILAEIDGNLYASYAVSMTEDAYTRDQFNIIVRQQDRL